jgi:regulator of protease activity HflC (stomatin/prohibitin superfamily)
MSGRFSNSWRRGREFLGEHSVSIGITSFVVLFLVVYLWKNIFIMIPAGNAGVLFKRLGGGTQESQVYDEGLHVISPWNLMTLYNVRLQQIKHTFSVISSNGLTVEVAVSIRYKPKTPLLATLHKEIGPDYATKIIIPEVQALIRNVFGQYNPEELYASKRSVVQNILQGSLDEIGEKYILLDDLLIESLKLPAAIQSAIESKLTEQQRALEAVHRLERERTEAERKVAEAKGVDEANRLIAESLTESVLKYHGIQATLELAKSENAKIVVFGNGGDGLPLVYNPDVLDNGAPPKSTNRPSRSPSPSSTAPPKTTRP